MIGKYMQSNWVIIVQLYERHLEKCWEKLEIDEFPKIETEISSNPINLAGRLKCSNEENNF